MGLINSSICMVSYLPVKYPYEHTKPNWTTASSTTQDIGPQIQQHRDLYQQPYQHRSMGHGGQQAHCERDQY